MRRKNIYLAWFALHFFLIAAISIRQLLWFIAAGLTIIPSDSGVWAQSEKIASAIGVDRLLASKPARATLLGYMHSAGIEGAYGFFAPNIPESYKLAFEFRDPDGGLEYDLPNVESRAAGFRLGSLLDMVGRSDSEQFRKIVVRMVTLNVWQNHPGAASAHAVFGKLKLPDPREYERGVRPSYEFIAAYEFERPADPNAR